MSTNVYFNALLISTNVVLYFLMFRAMKKFDQQKAFSEINKNNSEVRGKCFLRLKHCHHHHYHYYYHHHYNDHYWHHYCHHATANITKPTLCYYY